MPSAESLNLHPLYKDQNATHADLSLNDTNVNKLFNRLARTNTQVTTYDSRVGTGESLFQHLIAGAFGEGLVQKVKDGYTAIAKDYTPRDSIYIFGFSRGAYTARCLAGMIAICGLPTKGFEACVNTSDWPVCERQKEYMCTQLAKISVEYLQKRWPASIGSLGYLYDGTFGEFALFALSSAPDVVALSFRSTRTTL